MGLIQTLDPLLIESVIFDGTHNHIRCKLAILACFRFEQTLDPLLIHKNNIGTK
jgi:hypothetical protein